ncbi:BnaA08g12820D [Brassica napus]|uniref:BnaA08g12820D protein n=1 Tax=Brassica napus TaxID=3708 RepID=A0A078GD32_BRANA|nr:BnaA08g12820D [Brassica napus]
MASLRCLRELSRRATTGFAMVSLPRSAFLLENRGH